MPQPYETFTYLVDELSNLHIAYIHMVEPRAQGGDHDDDETKETLEPFRNSCKVAFIAAGGYKRENAAQAIAQGHADLIAFGRQFLANPDLPKRYVLGAELNHPDRSTFYTSDPVAGYTDYPFLDHDADLECCGEASLQPLASAPAGHVDEQDAKLRTTAAAAVGDAEDKTMNAASGGSPMQQA